MEKHTVTELGLALYATALLVLCVGWYALGDS